MARWAGTGRRSAARAGFAQVEMFAAVVVAWFLGTMSAWGGEATGAAPVMEITNWKSGISLKVLGKNGVDYAFERFYHDPLVDDHGVIYLRASTKIALEHNERNLLTMGYEASDGKIIGVHGADGKPDSGDEGVIRYKADLDWCWRGDWSKAGGEEKDRFPRFKEPFAFDDLTYFDGTRVAGSCGPSRPLDPLPKFGTKDFCWRGIQDDFGDEWHILTVGDDDSDVPGQTWYENWSSDGKIFHFVVNPKTPAIGFLTAGPEAQFYTTPAKAYFVPKVHRQTTCLTKGVSFFFTNLVDDRQPVLFRVDEIHKDAWHKYEQPVAVESLGLKPDTLYTLRYKVGEKGVEKVRRLHFEPSFPSDAETHPSKVLFKDEQTLARIRKLIQTDPMHRRHYAGMVDGSTGEPKDGLLAGSRTVSGRGAAALAFPVFLDGVGKHPQNEKRARRALLDHILLLDPIGHERTHTRSCPCREQVSHGYYFAGKVLDLALGYDLAIKMLRRPASPHGLTAIEDYKIRDLLGSFAMTTLQMKTAKESWNPIEVWPDTAPCAPSIGMWDTARLMALGVVAMVLPRYDTPYFGTSGADGTKAAHLFTPYVRTPMSWFEACNSREYGSGLYGVLSDDPEPVWKDRDGYLGGRMMGWIYAVLCNARLNFDGHRYPHVERAFLLATQGKLRATRKAPDDADFIWHYTCLLMNENFPEIAGPTAAKFAEMEADRREFERLKKEGQNPKPPKAYDDRSLDFSVWVNGVFGLCYHRPDWEPQAQGK